jgi:hypothetical protein
MPDTANLDDIVGRADEEEAVIADPQPQLFHAALKRLDIPRARFGESMQRMQNAHRSGFIHTANVGLGLFSPGDPLQAGSW